MQGHIKNANHNVAMTIVYDSARAKDVSRTILDKVADVAVPSNAIEDLGTMLVKAGIPPHKRIK